MKNFAIGAGTILLTMSSAWAVDCAKAVTTPELNECAAREQKAVEARLNSAYQAVLKELKQPDGETGSNTATRKKLVEAQRAWIKFREADCAAVYEYHSGGTIRNMAYSGCMQSRAEQRIKELESFVGP